MDEGEPFYPIPTPANLELYEKYKAKAASEYPDVTFLGRLGEYKYLDMDVCVEKALKASDKLLDTLQTRARQLAQLHYRPSLHRYAIQVGPLRLHKPIRPLASLPAREVLEWPYTVGGAPPPPRPK